MQGFGSCWNADAGPFKLVGIEKVEVDPRAEATDVVSLRIIAGLENSMADVKDVSCWLVEHTGNGPKGHQCLDGFFSA